MKVIEKGAGGLIKKVKSNPAPIPDANLRHTEKAVKNKKQEISSQWKRLMVAVTKSRHTKTLTTIGAYEPKARNTGHFPRKITYTYKPSDDVRRGGEMNVINTAIRMALDANGGGNVLLELQTTVKKKGKRNVSEVTVSCYPATYKK